MKRKKLRKRRFLAILLVFVLCMGMLDISAFAAAPQEDVADDAGQDEESKEESKQETGDSQETGDGQQDGGQNPEVEKPSGGAQNPEADKPSGGAQNPGGNQPSGGAQNSGDDNPSGGPKPENVPNTETSSEGVNAGEEGDTEVEENPDENVAPEYTSIEEFLTAAAAIGEMDDEESVREAIEICLSIYERLSEEDKADEAVQKAYEAVRSYEEDLGQGGINLLDDTYTVIYKDSEEYGGKVFDKFEGLNEEDHTPEYQASWFDGKDKDFYAWSPSWNKVVEGDKHEIVYTAMYYDSKNDWPITVQYRFDGSEEEAAPDANFYCKRGGTYTIPLPELNYNFKYWIRYPQNMGTVSAPDSEPPVGGTTSAIKYWVNYCPVVTVNHIYRVNGKEVGRETKEEQVSVGFGQYSPGNRLRNAVVTDWETKIGNENPAVIKAPYMKSWGGKSFTYNSNASDNRLTMPANPSDVTEPFVMNLYYDRSAPELTISKTADKTEVKPGEEVIYTITVENVGGLSGYVTVKDVLPNELTFDSYTLDTRWISSKPTNDQYSLSAINAGKTKTLKIKAKVKEDVAGGITIKNTATAVLDNIDVASASADITVAKTYPLTVYFLWENADKEYEEVAAPYKAMLKAGEAYSVQIPEANVPFAYTTTVRLDGKGDKLDGTMKALEEKIWIYYYPLFQVNHIYRRDGDQVGYALWDENTVSWYADQVYSYVPNYQSLTYGSFNSKILTAERFRYPWVFWDPVNKPNEYETFTFTSEDTVALPGNPADLKETPVVNMYYDKTTYVDVTVKYVYEVEDGTQTELLEEYKETLAKKSSYDVSEFAYETITADGVTYRQDSVEGELTGTAMEDKTITVKYVIVEETPENPTDPTPPVNPPTGGGGGGGGTPDPTPTPPTPPAPDPISVVPIPVEPVPAAVVPNVTPVESTPVADVPEAAATAALAEEAVPLVGGEKAEEGQTAEVEEEAVPLAGGEGGSWALFNFALMNLAIFESIMLLIGYFVRTKNDEEERKLKKKGLFRIISLPIAVISLVVFILTENIHLQTALVDKYTIIMLLIAIVQTVMVVLSNKKYEEEQEEQ